MPEAQGVTYSLVIVARVPSLSGAPSFIEIGALTGWSGLSWEEALNDECAATVTIDPQGQTPAIRARLADLVDATELWIYRGSELVFAGPVIGNQPQASEGGIVATLSARSLWHYVRRWPIEPAITLTYSGVEQFQIVRNLIGYWQALDYGHFGLTVTSGDSGITRDRTYVGAENHNIGQRIEELAALSTDGFDFRIIPATRLVELGFPTLGTDKTATVTLDRRNIVDPGAMFSVGPEDLASEAYAVSPQQDPDPALTSHSFTADVRERWGRIGTFTSVQDVSNQGTLDGHADRLAADRDEMFYQPGPELIPVGGADISDFTVGDRIEMVYDYGFGEFVAQRRVLRRRVAVSETGDETISVEFGAGSQTTVKEIKSMGRRVAELEATSGAKGATPTVGYVDRQSNVATTSASLVDLTGLSVDVDVKSGHRYKITLYFPLATHSNGSGSRAQVAVTDGANTQIQIRNFGFVSSGGEAGGTLVAYDLPASSGSKTYKGRVRVISVGTLTLLAASDTRITLTVEDMGAA